MFLVRSDHFEIHGGACFCVLVLIFISVSQVFHRSASAGSPAVGSSRAASRPLPTGIESFPLPQVPSAVTEQVCCRLDSKDTRGQNSSDLNHVLSLSLGSPISGYRVVQLRCSPKYLL